MMGWLEMIVGLSLVVGFMTPVFAVIAAVMLWSFAVSKPVIGALRLSRDLMLMSIAAAVATGGSGRWALDQVLRPSLSPGAWMPGRKNIVSVPIRYSLALYSHIIGGLPRWGGGQRAKHYAPVLLVGVMGVMPLLGVYPRVVPGGARRG